MDTFAFLTIVVACLPPALALEYCHHAGRSLLRSLGAVVLLTTTFFWAYLWKHDSGLMVVFHMVIALALVIYGFRQRDSIAKLIGGGIYVYITLLSALTWFA